MINQKKLKSIVRPLGEVIDKESALEFALRVNDMLYNLERRVGKKLVRGNLKKS